MPGQKPNVDSVNSHHLLRSVASPAASLVRAGLAAGFLATSLAAQNFTWTGNGGDGNWGHGSNFAEGAIGFGNATDVFFHSPGAGKLSDNFIGGDRVIRSLHFTADADSAVTIRTIATATGMVDGNLNFSGTNPTISVASGAEGDFTIGSGGGNITLSDNLAVTHNGTGLLIMGQPILQSGGNRSITMNGTGTLQFSAANVFGGALNINAGKLLASGSSNADVNTASSINLSGGTLHVTTNATSKNYTTHITTTAATSSSLIYENTSLTTANVNLSTGALTMGGNLSIRNISANITAQNVVVQNRNMTGAGKLSYESYNNIASIAANYSLGRMQITGNNTGFSGDLEVRRGVVNFTSNTATNSVGTGKLILGTTGDSFGAGVYFNPGGTAGSTLTAANDIIVRSGGFRSLRSSGDYNFVYSGNVTLEGNLNFDMAMTSSRTAQLSGNITGEGGLEITRSTGTGDYVLLSGNNSYTGNTAINANSELRINSASGNGIGDLSAVTLSSAGSQLRIQSDETIGSLASIGNDGDLKLYTGSNATIAANGRTITTGGNNQSTTYGGTSSGSGGIIKTGNGTFTLTGNNTYTGATIINGGTLAIDGANDRLPVGTALILTKTAGAALELKNGFHQTVASLEGGGGIRLGGGTLTISGDASGTYAGVISGNGSLVKTGSGTLSLSGNNSHTGGTTVQAGTLSIAALNGNYTVAGSATLAVANSVTETQVNALLASGGFTAYSALAFDTSAGDRTHAAGIGNPQSEFLRLVKTGGNTLTLSGVNPRFGETVVKSGTLALSATASLPDTSDITLQAGSTLALETGANIVINGYLRVAGDATLHLPAGAATLSFYDCNSVSWSGGTLVIAGTFRANSIRFGNSASGLNVEQIRRIRIGNDYAMLDANGYLQRVLATGMEVTGNLATTPFTLVGGGVLSGNGTVGSLQVGTLGRLAPGTGNATIAALSSTGNLTLETGSVVEVHATRATSNGTVTNDRLLTSGTARVSGTFDLLLSGKALKSGDELELVTGNISMPTCRSIPARITVNPDSTTPLAPGLELTSVYYSNKVTALVRAIDSSPGLQRNGGFEQGMHFWDVNNPGNGATRTCSIDASNPADGKTSLRVAVTKGIYPGDVLIYQNFNVIAGQPYTISFKVRSSVARKMAWGLQNTKLSRGTGFPAPAIGGFINYGVNIGTSWTTVSQTWTPSAAESAVLQFMLGEADGTVWIDGVKITGPSLDVSEPFRVTAYARAGLRNNIPREFYQHIDRLIYAFIMSDINGNVVPYYPLVGQNQFTPEVRDFFQGLKNDYGLELLVAIGGGDTPNYADDFFETVIASPSLRTTLINNLRNFCHANGFDGLDLDYEYPEAAIEQVNFGVFVAEAKTAFAAAGLKLTAAVDTYGGVYFPPQTYRDLAANHVMGYNMDSDLMVRDTLELFAAGAPMSKIYPGVIFAAVDNSVTPKRSVAYRDMFSPYNNYNPLPHENVAGPYVLNGIRSVQQKIQIARQLGCGGVMIWDLPIDSPLEEYSLTINALEDSDGDALLDRWENDFFGNLDAARPLRDDDGDGLSNLWENLTATDPLKGSSAARPKPQIIEIAGNRHFGIRFPLVNGNRLDVRIQGSGNLADWFELDAAPGGDVELTMDAFKNLTIRQNATLDAGHRFLRVTAAPLR